MRLRFLVATAAVALAASPTFATVYDFNLNVGGEVVTGFIKTDGTLGTLSTTNIVDYSFTVGGLTYGASPRLEFRASSLVASSTALTYNFTPTSNSYALFWGQRDTNATAGYLCFQNNGCFDFDGGGIAVGFSPFATSRLTGIQAIATAATGAVPEPATWAMLILGFGAVGAATRRRSVMARASQPTYA